MRSFIESDHPEIAMTKLKTGFIPNHVGYVYEDICRQKMWELNAQGKLPFLFDRVGRWWGGKDTEIDIVAIDTTDRSKIIFGECKFHQNVPMQLSELHQLKEKAAVVPWGMRIETNTLLYSVSVVILRTCSSLHRRILIFF